MARLIQFSLILFCLKGKVMQESSELIVLFNKIEDPGDVLK